MRVANGQRADRVNCVRLVCRDCAAILWLSFSVIDWV